MSSFSATLQALALPQSAEEALGNFTKVFQKWNRSINLSAARTEADLADHIRDSLHVVPHLMTARVDATSTTRILDVGAGGGLPAVVMAICCPDAHFTALEPVHKKHAFLRTVARELSLVNLDARAERLDDHASRDYDVATSRATFDLRDWLLTGLTYVRPGGTVLGFEAVPRTDLPRNTSRHPYRLGEKSRAIVALRRLDT